MKNTRKIAITAMALFFTGVSAMVYAQVPQPASPPQGAMPNQTPAQMQPQQTQPDQMSPMDQQQSPAMNQPQNQSPDLNLNQVQTNTKVSDKELKQFASVYPKVKDETQKAQQQMAAVIEKDGMKLDRFNELETAKLQNQKSDATKDEKKTFKKITKDLDAMQPQLQKNLNSVIASSGLSVERFQAIALAIQHDSDLQSRFQKIMGGGSKGS